MSPRTTEVEGAVLLTGATGYIGGKLLAALLEERVPLRALVRDPTRLPRAVVEDAFDVVTADLSDEETLHAALEGVEEAFYLVHSMEPGVAGGFAERDRAAARNYATCASAAGVRRTIYLGGVSPEGAASEHLASRREVEEILATATPEFVGLRASMIVGGGSGSFRTLAQIVERLPVLPLPSWRDQRTQPIAVEDVVRCLARARNVEPGVYEIAGDEAPSFEEMTGVVAQELGQPHRTFPLPVSNARAEGAAAAVISDADRELLEPLMAGLHEDLLVSDNAIRDVFEVEPMTFRDAVRIALSEMQSSRAPA